jgi:hypothetical protein
VDQTNLINRLSGNGASETSVAPQCDPNIARSPSWEIERFEIQPYIREHDTREL